MEQARKRLVALTTAMAAAGVMKTPSDLPECVTEAHRRPWRASAGRVVGSFPPLSSEIGKPKPDMSFRDKPYKLRGRRKR